MIQLIEQTFEDAELAGYTEPGWYFWDETASLCYGPYETPAQAQQAEDDYVKHQLQPPPMSTRQADPRRIAVEKLAQTLIATFQSAITKGYRHYDPVTNEELRTAKEILECFRDRGSISIKTPVEHA